MRWYHRINLGVLRALSENFPNLDLVEVLRGGCTPVGLLFKFLCFASLNGNTSSVPLLLPGFCVLCATLYEWYLFYFVVSILIKQCRKDFEVQVFFVPYKILWSILRILWTFHRFLTITSWLKLRDIWPTSTRFRLRLTRSVRFIIP